MPTDTPTFHECTTITSIKTPRQQTVPLRQAGRAKRRGWIKRKTNLINGKPQSNPLSCRDTACRVRKKSKADAGHARNRYKADTACRVPTFPNERKTFFATLSQGESAGATEGLIETENTISNFATLKHRRELAGANTKKRQCIICTDGTLSFIILITSC